MPPENTTTESTTTQTDPAKGSVAASTTGTIEAWKAPESKEAFEKAIADAVGAVESKYKAPEKYEGLKLPENSKADAQLTERTAATARSLGLSNENAQKALEFIAQEVTSHREAAAKEVTEAFAPGGSGWKEVVDKWNADALSDPLVGNGKPEVLAQKRALAEKAAARFGDQAFVELLKNDPMGSHPAVIRFLSAVGGAIGEPTLVKETADAGPGAREIDPKKFFNHPTSVAAMEKQTA